MREVDAGVDHGDADRRQLRQHAERVECVILRGVPLPWQERVVRSEGLRRDRQREEDRDRTGDGEASHRETTISVFESPVA